MHPNPSRVAYRHFTAGSADQLIATVRSALESVQKQADDLAATSATLDRLIAAGEARRLGRTSDIKVMSPRFDGQKLTSTMQGRTGVYDTRITFLPRAGHHCTCPDWQQRGRQVGPCKHVLALGEYWRDEEVIPQLKNLGDTLVGTLF